MTTVQTHRILTDLEETAIRSSPALALHHILSDITTTRSLGQHHMATLSSLCPKALPGALQLLDKNAVTKGCTPMGREVHLVTPTARTTTVPYVVLEGYCACRAYAFQVAAGEELHCKHSLAVLLSEALGVVRTVELDELKFAALLA